MAKRSPLKVLLFLILLLVVAYLCKRGWDGFYNTPGVWVSTRFIQLIHGHHWWTWDVPIPTADGIYSCVADAGDGRKIMWTCTVSRGQYTVSGLSKQGNICEVRLHFSATMTQGASPSTSSAYGFPTYPSTHRPAYFGIDFWYCSPDGANYVLTVTQIDPPPVASAGSINIVEASYGANCIGGNKGNRTSFFKSLADGKSALDYIYNFRNTGGDPAPYCPKNLDITYNCGDGVSKYWGPATRPEAGDDSPVSLRCPVAAPPPPAAACPACPACNSCVAPKACVDMTPYMLKAKCLLTDVDQNPDYMLITDCECPRCKQHRQS